ncbi:MAG TPA: phosphatidylserine decarboxylase family protein [Thermoanaerobaculia bacterium]|nr:phosphatidylserine decarboxylase family protein [Thermoanaerobaculia bacterium]
MTLLRSTTPPTQTQRLGGWLPDDPNVLNEWLAKTISEAESKNAEFHPVVEEFRVLIESDPVLFMDFTLMFEQQPVFPPPPGSGDVKLENYQQMLTVINHVLTIAPEYNTTGMVGFPINAILDFPMITPAGLSAFTMQNVNAMFMKILNAWNQFLDSADSRYVLNDGPQGWFSPAARKAIHLDQFQTQPDQPYLGFKSWNDFFIREFKLGQRPIADPGDDRVVVSACESAPYAIQTNVQETDTFWLKAQPYSLRQMLNGNYIDHFLGGTVYQAYLSALDYHRWHAPVSGTIKKIEHIAGTYYAEAASEGFDPAGPNNSQGYIAHVATRALIFIEADNANIGLMCIEPIGMAEVSTCILALADGTPLEEGMHVTKGEQIGYFQFGGSTHCLVFAKGVIEEFAAGAIPQGENGENSTIVPVNSFLARTK